MSNVKKVSHVNEVKGMLLDALAQGLEKCGMVAESYAKEKCPVDTGQLRNSITHKVVEDDKTVYIGTNMEYAPYVELGTGQFISGGRDTPWVFQDANGDWHRTEGQRPQPYLKPAITEHADEYREIIKSELGDA